MMHRLGPLRLDEVDLLLPLVHKLEALESGVFKAKTPERRRFLSVCCGRLAPSTTFEYAYLKWKALKKPDLNELREAMLGRTTDSAPRRISRSSSTPPLRAAYLQEREQKRQVELKKIQEQAEERWARDSGKKKLVPAKRHIKEWGTRDDWRRDRGSWRRPKP